MNPYLIPALSLSPSVFEKLASKIDPASLDSPTHPGRFTPREVIAHLADWEPILLERIKQTISRPGTELKVFDEGDLAVQHSYAKTDITEQLNLFSERRKETVAFLSSLRPADWDEHAVHPERGVLTVRDQANMLPGHDMYHVEQLVAMI